MGVSMLRSLLLGAAVLTAVLQGSASAEEFYRGKTIRLIVP